MLIDYVGLINNRVLKLYLNCKISLRTKLFALFEKCNNIAKIYMPLTIAIVYREKRDKNK